jgi:hypothetical protein
MRSSLARYYELLDDLVVLVPEDGRGWTGRVLPVAECEAVVDELDVRGIARRVRGLWRDDANPLAADTAQRQVGVDALSGSVDWILQVDNDEILPDPAELVRIIEEAGDAQAIEWPMRVLFRHLRGATYLEVVGRGGTPFHEYPGPVAVRSNSTLVDARRTSGQVTRVVVVGDTTSLQVARPPGPEESRRQGLTASAAIVHNSWGKSVGQTWRKTRSWGHAEGWRSTWYYATTWLPAPLTWRWLRDFHPFAHGLWWRLARVELPAELLEPQDRRS